jgi:hypothetical protein
VLGRKPNMFESQAAFSPKTSAGGLEEEHSTLPEQLRWNAVGSCNLLNMTDATPCLLANRIALYKVSRYIAALNNVQRG